MNLEDTRDRDQALTVPCSYCHVPAGELCVRLHDRAPLANVAAHTPRLREAGVVHAPIDSRELRRG